jgi:AraC family transcriptional activator of pobA
MKGIPTISKINAEQYLKISAFKEVIKPTVPHKHADYFELIILTQGAGYHTIDHNTFEVTPPTIYFLKPGQTHCWDFSRIPKGFVILFREGLLNSTGLEVIHNLPACVPLDESDSLFDLIRIFFNDYQRAAPLTVLKVYLQLILSKIAEQANTSTQYQKPSNSVYYRFKSLINEHYRQIKKIQPYANLLNLAPARLNSICKSASGKTPAMLLNERVLLEAKTLLSNTDLSIKQVANDLAFSDTSHFVKFFKQHTNLTPVKYRDIALHNYTANTRQLTVK